MYIFDISFYGIHIAPTWYGLMYAIGFIVCYEFMRKTWKFRENDIETLLYFVFAGVLFGGRFGYILLYGMSYFLDNPGEILHFWKGGMSFHGGLIGVIIAILIFSRWKKYVFFEITDFLAVIVPVALGLGRIGNFMNQELLGFTPYNGSFAMIKNGNSYFPSPLFEMLLEGCILFGIMIFSWYYLQMRYKKNMPTGYLSAIFLIGYSFMRGIAEQFRLPDEHIGYLFGTSWITIGFIYTIPMFLGGCILFYISRERWITKRSLPG